METLPAKRERAAAGATVLWPLNVIQLLPMALSGTNSIWEDDKLTLVSSKERLRRRKEIPMNRTRRQGWVRVGRGLEGETKERAF